LKNKHFFLLIFIILMFICINEPIDNKTESEDPEKWDDNVENYVLKLTYPESYNDEVVGYGYVRGSEPYNYVREIFERYERYKQFIPI